ncbi:Karyopherin transporter [Rhizopus azygosporus]|uniref:Karyopherin transporter n=1 Tax=Rhizopus azygosporus TaxID=86630 RepID=A0A367KGJ7_RHIAZ|nr:Karyopherin transporter [Rhizopus azygosporus]
MLTKYKDCINDIDQILVYLLSISRIPDIDICKICTGYWETFVEQDDYRQIQRELAVVITETMVMPNDILRVQDEDGEIIQEYIKQSDTAALYDSMQHILQAITKREPEFIQSVLHDRQIIPSLIECYKIANGDENSSLPKHIRKAVIQLLECFILSIHSQVDISEIQGLLQVIAADYVQSSDQREPLVLSLLANIFEKIDNPVATVWPAILNQTIDILFSHTLSMLIQNFSDFPEIRAQFYRLLEVIVKRYIQDIFRTPELLDSVINCIIWGTKHIQIEISHTALKTCLFVLDNALQEEDDVASQFFEIYYVRILTDTLEILLDPDCRNGFEYQTQIISKMLRMIQEGEIYTRVFSPEQVSNPLMSNMEFLQNYILDLLTNTYPLLQKSQLEVLVMGMFDYSDDLQRFQNDIQDFLIDIREVDEESVGYERAQEETEAELELLRNI